MEGEREFSTLSLKIKKKVTFKSYLSEGNKARAKKPD